ncbi:LOW QUALITY PROTEIN: dynein light chain roadblock-type 1 [Ammospiza caudacuta]|uniref:LOW QUALITY PROTEIN: dynein light chain roadblock-type 1 n=1 Tax=Ammospiza caudacuta TaxID=2857398 RepID=UPI00273A03F1|nr:LOW QUALITY PROTEIN: dynein light chain roadblock-type 1 [Ammospiza caudacuta]
MSLKRDQGPLHPRELGGDLCGLRGLGGSGLCLGAGPPRAPSASGAAPGPTRGGGGGGGGGGGSIMAEVEETLKRIQSQKGVQGIIVVNSEGIPIKSTIDNATTIQYAGLMHSFIMKARSTVRDIDPQNDLTFLRIRSKKNEIMVAPDKDYFLIVIQNPTE